MPNFEVKKYVVEDFEQWNAFVAHSKNGTFLFDRNYMDYHSDRFVDYSLIVLKDNKWLAVLPANIVDNQLFSHQGLTYGSLVYGDKPSQIDIIESLKSILIFLEKNNIIKLIIKLIPSIYHQKPASEIDYALFLAQAKLYRRDALSVLDLTKPNKISKTRLECVRRGNKNNLTIKEGPFFDDFWNLILTPNLKNRYNVLPTHSVDEIKLLHSRFPYNIRHFNVYDNDKIVAGTTIFVTQNVIHPQHISAVEDRNQSGCVDFLYHHLITNVFKNEKYFDFGISNEQQGTKLNQNLIFWKESFGASTIVQDFYEIETKNHQFLNQYLL